MDIIEEIVEFPIADCSLRCDINEGLSGQRGGNVPSWTRREITRELRAMFAHPRRKFADLFRRPIRRPFYFLNSKLSLRIEKRLQIGRAFLTSLLINFAPK